MLQNYQSITLQSAHYPALLKQIPKPPKQLFYEGNLQLLQKTCISIVGTRRNTDYGEYATEKIVSELACADVVIVSGLAKGIDAIAHKAALENGLPTIAVLGTGLKNIYPRQNINLAKEILRNGLVISEYEDHPPTKDVFPQRNRIISGLSLATIVIEAPEQSGALITAYFALDQNREVFTIPADIDRPESLGNLKLLKKSWAHPISCGKDILEILNDQSKNIDFNTTAKESPVSQQIPLGIDLKLNETEKIILGKFQSKRGITLPKIFTGTNINSAEVLSAISTLEIEGLINFKDGKYYRCC